MQAKLPDVNAILVTFRNAYLYNLRMRDWNRAVAMLYEMNATLPEDYRVEINTEKYREMASSKKFAECLHCKTEHPASTIKPHDVMNDFIVRSLTGVDFKRIWNCPSCNKENLLRSTEFIIDEKKKPTYFRVIESPPVKNGWSDMDTFPNKISEWLSRFSQELSNQCSKYRSDYVRQEEQSGFGLEARPVAI